MSPAATITDGFDVLVQLVIAARKPEPCPSTCLMSSIRSFACDGRGGVSPACPPSPSHRPTGVGPADATAATGGAIGFISEGNASANLRGTSRKPTRSCGRPGPALLRSPLATCSPNVSGDCGP